MSNLIISPPFSDNAAITAGSEDASFPASNILEQELWKRWRIPTTDIMDGYAVLDFSDLTPLERGRADPNSVIAEYESVWFGFLPGDVSINAEVAATAADTGTPPYERVVPAAIISSTNMDTAIGIEGISEDPYNSNPDAFLGISNATLTEVRISMSTPTGGVATQDREQVARFLVSTSDASLDPFASITVQALQADNTVIEGVQAFYVPYDGGSYLIQYAWGLGSAAKSNVEFVIKRQSGSFDLIAADWVARDVAMGWTPVYNSSGLFPNNAGPIPRNHPIVARVKPTYIFAGEDPGHASSNDVLIMVRDLYRGMPGHSYGYDFNNSWVQIRRVFAARDIEADYLGGSVLTPTDPSESTSGPSGARFYDPRPVYRQGRLDLVMGEKALYLDDLLRKIDLTLGATSHVGIALLPTQAADQAHNLTMLAEIHPSETSLGTPGFNEYSRSINFREVVR